EGRGQKGSKARQKVEGRRLTAEGARCCPPAVYLQPSTALEAVPEAELPDLHEPGLRRDAAESLVVDLVAVDAVELRRVRQVEELETDLTRLVAGELRLLRDHKIDV